MKIIPFVTLFFLISLFSFSQSIKFGVGPTISFPTGNFGDGSGIGIGAEFNAVYSFSDNLEAFGLAGIHHFFPKKLATVQGIGTLKSDAINHLPFLVGARYRSEKVFGGVGFGYGIYKDVSGFTFSPHVGYQLENIDLQLHYTSTSVSGGTLGYFGVKGVYYFTSND